MNGVIGLLDYWSNGATIVSSGWQTTTVVKLQTCTLYMMAQVKAY